MSKSKEIIYRIYSSTLTNGQQDKIFRIMKQLCYLKEQSRQEINLKQIFKEFIIATKGRILCAHFIERLMPCSLSFL